MDIKLFTDGLKCLCPSCRKTSIFKHRWSLDLKDTCDQCGLDLAKNDSGDGPAVLMTFILGFSVIPMALIADAIWTVPLWVHATLWPLIMLVMTLGMLKPLKAYIIALQYKHRKTDWE